MPILTTVLIQSYKSSYKQPISDLPSKFAFETGEPNRTNIGTVDLRGPKGTSNINTFAHQYRTCSCKVSVSNTALCLCHSNFGLLTAGEDLPDHGGGTDTRNFACQQADRCSDPMPTRERLLFLSIMVAGSLL